MSENNRLTLWVTVHVRHNRQHLPAWCGWLYRHWRHPETDFILTSLSQRRWMIIVWPGGRPEGYDQRIRKIYSNTAWHHHLMLQPLPIWDYWDLTGWRRIFPPFRRLRVRARVTGAAWLKRRRFDFICYSAKLHLRGQWYTKKEADKQSKQQKQQQQRLSSDSSIKKCRERGGGQRGRGERGETDRQTDRERERESKVRILAQRNAERQRQRAKSKDDRDSYSKTQKW